VSTGFNSIRNIISNVMDKVRSIISSIWNRIKSTVSSVVNSIKNTVSNIFNSLRSIVSSAFSRVRDAVRNGINRALDIVRNIKNKFFDAGRNIVTAIADGIKGAISKVTSAISNVTQKIRNFLPFSPPKEGPLIDIMDVKWGETIAAGIEKGEKEIAKAMERVLTFDLTRKTSFSEPLYNSGTAYDNRTINITIDAGNIEELQRVIEIFTGLKQTVRQG